MNDIPSEYVTKDLSAIRELLHPDRIPGLGVSLAEAVVEESCSTIRHYHIESDEIYYCLEGEGTLYINEKEYEFSTGKYYLIPKNASHLLTAKTRLRLLCICHPPYSHEQTVLIEED